MTRLDWALCLVLMAVYGAVAFFNLGDVAAPQTNWAGEEPIMVDFGEAAAVGAVRFMAGPAHEQPFYIAFSPDGVEWSSHIYLETALTDPFAWRQVFLPEPVYARYGLIAPQAPGLILREMTFHTGAELHRLPIVGASPSGWPLFDEQHLAPDRPSFRNSAYFDEIYHARTAYEYLHRLPAFENTHPPLGKVFISWGVSLLGMTPFGWRFMGALAGVLMLLPLYALAKRLFASSGLAFLAAFVFAFDFMHFVQPRFATLDGFLVLAVICMYYFMYVYISTDFARTPFAKTLLPLFFCGWFMGIGLAVKWLGAFAAIGLAMLFFAAVFRIPPKHRMITMAWCIPFFVLIPALVYLLSYIPFTQAAGQAGLSAILKNQADMFNYHGMLTATHPYSSPWWSWPLNLRPVFYYASQLGDLRAGISAFGNPAVWWLGIPAFCYAAYSALFKRDRAAAFLSVGYLAQFLPWALIGRIAFIYHYFPSLPFLVLMNVFLIKHLAPGRWGGWAYAATVFALFVLFYPVLSGWPIAASFAGFLRWLPGWQLV